MCLEEIQGLTTGADFVFMNPELCVTAKDSVAALLTLPTEGVQLIVTSPPYDDLRGYGEHKWDFKSTAREMHRVLCNGGVLCWNIGDSTENGSETLTSSKQKIYFVESCGFGVHDTMIYQKRNFSHPEKSRYHQVFEYVFILSKGKPRCFNPIMDRRNITAGKIGNLGVNTFTERDGSKSIRSKKVTKEFGMRHNVWLGNTRGQEDMCIKLKHPAMMPKWLARDLIASWSNPGDLVADPFAGSGTTGIEALKLGRRAWINDIESSYLSEIKSASGGVL